MQAIEDAILVLLTSAVDVRHWPFFSMCFVLAVIGQIMSKRVFTRQNARHDFGKDTRGRLLHELFYWGRETMPLHAITASALIGLAWQDPEGRGWGKPETAAYWLLCGVSSLFLWAAIKGWAKRKGLVLEMPGDSDRPPRFTPYTIETLPPDVLIDDNDPPK